MSFIFQDKQLVDLLVRQGQAATPGNQYVGISPQDFAAMRGLVSNLQEQLSGGEIGAGPQVASESGSDVDLISSHLENIGTLVEFLARNQITIDGKRIAYAINEDVRDPSYQLYKLEGAAGLLEPADRRETVQRGYHINMDLLKRYIGTLQAQVAKTPNPPLQAQLNSIVQQANEQLDANVSKEYQEPAKTLPPNQELDRIPQNFTTQSPTTDGNIPLTFGDLASDTAFNAWIQKNNIAIDSKLFRNPQYNKCALVSGFDQRAKANLGNAASEKDKYIYTVYAEQVAKLAATLHCDLAAGQKPGGQTGEQAAGATSGVASKAAGLQQIVSTLPLRLTDIDFGRIRNFLETYRGTALSSADAGRAQQMSGLISQVEGYMTNAQQNTVGGNYTNFHMDGLTAQDLITWANPPSPGQAVRARGSAVALADYLYYIVTNVAALIQNLRTTHADVLAQPQFSQLRQSIEQQAGGDRIPFGSSIAANNLDNIRAARARLPAPGAP